MTFWLTLKELLTANYDPKLDKVNNCRPHSLAWYHEMRHKKQFNTKFVYYFEMYSYNVFWAISGLLLYIGLRGKIFKESLAAIGFISLPLFFVRVILEIDAWISAFYQHYQYWKRK